MASMGLNELIFLTKLKCKQPQANWQLTAQVFIFVEENGVTEVTFAEIDGS